MMFRFGVLDWQLLPRLAAGLQAAEMLGGRGALAPSPTLSLLMSPGGKHSASAARASNSFRGYRVKAEGGLLQSLLFLNISIIILHYILHGN